VKSVVKSISGLPSLIALKNGLVAVATPALISTLLLFEYEKGRLLAVSVELVNVLGGN